MDEQDRKQRLARWIPGDTPPEGPRLAQRRLAAAIRRINHLLLDMEPPQDELERAAIQAEQFAERLAEAPKKEAVWGYAETSNAGNPRAMFDRSPLIGLGNPVSPPLRLDIDGDYVVGTATYGTAYEGPPGHVHGGIVASSFDEVLGLVQSLTGNPGMTGTLTIRYRRPTPLHRELAFRGSVDRVEGRKIFTRATLHDGETLCAEAEGIFISVDMTHFERMAQQAQNEE